MRCVKMTQTTDNKKITISYNSIGLLCRQFYAVFLTRWRHLVNDFHSTHTCCVLATTTTNFSENKRTRNKFIFIHQNVAEQLYRIHTHTYTNIH